MLHNLCLDDNLIDEADITEDAAEVEPFSVSTISFNFVAKPHMIVLYEIKFDEYYLVYFVIFQKPSLSYPLLTTAFLQFPIFSPLQQIAFARLPNAPFHIPKFGYQMFLEQQLKCELKRILLIY